jgi:hypothetical protein
MTLAAAAMTKGTVSNEDLRGFSIKTTEPRFLYNDEIAKFLEEIQQQAPESTRVVLCSIEDHGANPKRDQPEQVPCPVQTDRKSQR